MYLVSELSKHVEIFKNSYRSTMRVRQQPNVPIEFLNLLPQISINPFDERNGGPYSEQYIFENRHNFNIGDLIDFNCIPSPGLLEYLCSRTTPRRDPFTYVEQHKNFFAHWLVYFARPRHLSTIRKDATLWKIYKNNTLRQTPAEVKLLHTIPQLSFLAARSTRQVEDLAQLPYLTYKEFRRYLLLDSVVNFSLIQKYLREIKNDFNGLGLNYIWQFCTLSEEYLPEPEPLAEGEVKRTKKENPNTLPVWDLEKLAWRSFRVDSVVEYEPNF